MNKIIETLVWFFNQHYKFEFGCNTALFYDNKITIIENSITFGLHYIKNSKLVYWNYEK